MNKRALPIVIMLTLLVAAATAQARPAESQLSLPAHKRVQLENGMTLLLMEQHELPLVSFAFVVRAGSVADPKGKEGLASLTAELLRKGTKTRTAQQFASDLDFIGGEFDTSADYDYTAGSAEFTAKTLDRGLELMADALRNPTFLQGEVSKLVEQRVDGIKSSKDQALAVLGDYFGAFLYGSHPYGRPSGGDEKSVAALTREDVTGFYQQFYKPGNVIVAVAGDFQPAEMEKKLRQTFGDWQGTGSTNVEIPDAAPAEGRRLLLVDKPDSTQTYFAIGNLGIKRTNPDRPYVDVVNTLFGGRFTSMLNTALRIQSGLSYGAGSFFEERLKKGPFIMSSYTRNETTEQALDLTLDVLQRLHQQEVGEEDLASARNYVRGRFPTSIETTSQLAALLAGLEFYGLDTNEVETYYRKVGETNTEIANRMVREYFPTEGNLVWVVIGKADEIGSVVKKYAPEVKQISISKPGFGSQ